MANESFYRLSLCSRARRESFGILFYSNRDGKLTFVRSGDSLDVGETEKGSFLVPAGGDVQKKTGHLIKALMTKGLLETTEVKTDVEQTCGGAARPAQPTIPRRAAAHREALQAPVNVTWESTARCNLRCRHCLSADVMEHSGPELDFNQCRGFIDDLVRMRVFQINFGGGEPFLRPDFLDILEYAHRKRITTCVSTNGTTLDDALVQRLKKMDLLYIQVSLDGAHAATNDLLRGPGTFQRILSGIRLLTAHQIQGVSTNTVVTAINFQEIRQICELGAQYGVKTRLSRFRPSGNAKNIWAEYHLNKEQLAELSQFLSAHKDVLTGDSFFSITGRDRRELGLNMCGAAKMTCSVLPDGTVYPCAFLQDAPFKAGNVVLEKLESVWKEAPAFEALRKARVESCESCSRFSLCHGGCPAVAYYLTQSVNQPDPECIATFPHRHHLDEPRGEISARV
jgi:mycofactocin radical SAM maturase